MKNSIRFFVGFSLLVLIACYGCGVENSEAEMQAAKEAMDNAKSLYAEDLVTADWNDAMKAWEQGQAAVKEGKPAKTYFLRAKSRFEKTATIAKSLQDDLSKEVSEMQMRIGERYARVKAALERGSLNSRARKEIEPIVAEIEEGNASIASLVRQGNYLKAKTTASEVQTKVYNAELIMAGKKPAS